MDAPPNRRELENQWRERLTDAKLQGDLARSLVRDVESDLKAAGISSADGKYAHQQALRVEQLALEHYRRVLDTFTNLLLRGEVPEESKDGGGAERGPDSD